MQENRLVSVELKEERKNTTKKKRNILNDWALNIKIYIHHIQNGNNTIFKNALILIAFAVGSIKNGCAIL